ncbi:hypothetical protein PVA47_06950 [Entomospira culicis]|nr:hypothetical protein [Entomospira culicis]WDI38677.1 hypothetical protein PVA47_06950 [Entomospira culicis]
MRNTRNRSQLHGKISVQGVEIWRHFFWATSLESGLLEPFLLEFLLLNPDHKERKQQPYFHAKGSSFAMVRVVRLLDGSHPATFVSMQEVELSNHILSLRFGRNVCLEDASTGQIVTLDKDIGVRFGLASAGSASWELQIEKSQSYGYGFIASRWITAYRLVGMSWHVGGLKATFDGRLFMDEDEFKVHASTSYGYQDKIWGGYIGQEWAKLYGGALYDADSGQEAKSDCLTIFRHQQILLGKVDGHTYRFIYVHEGVLYDFSSDQKKTIYAFKESKDADIYTVMLEAITAHERLLVTLRFSLDAPKTLEYPYVQGGNLRLRLATPVTGEVELFRLMPLNGWQRDVHQRLNYALYESSSLP